MATLRRIAFAAVYLALIVTAALLLHAFAQRQFTAHLSDRAAHALALAARGDTPYRWTFESADDIVAGRVFGAREFAFDAGQLTAYSDGRSFEIGLPLARSVDLHLFPHLQIGANSDAPTLLTIVVRETLDGAERVSAPASLVPGAGPLDVDLQQESWTVDSRPVATPKSAAMLRLRFALQPSGTLRLRKTQLLRAAGARLDLAPAPQTIDDASSRAVDGTPVYRLPFRSEVQSADIAAIVALADPREPVLVLLPQRGRVEQQIALRNAVFAALPGAILIPDTALDETFAHARLEAGGVALDDRVALRWSLLAGYVIALLWSRLRPARNARARALIEVILVLAGPLWLILLDGFTGKPDALQYALIAVTTAYVLSLSMPHPWRWNGSARAWLLAVLVAGFASLLGLALHAAEPAPNLFGWSHLARYLIWALLQQYLVCAICTDRWRIVTGNSAAAVYLGALGFALMHTPNAALMIATFAGGLCWCALYLRERALLPLALSHVVSALALLALLPRSLLASAEVSVRFFQ